MTSMRLTNGAAMLVADLIGVNYITICVRQTGSGFFEYHSGAR